MGRWPVARPGPWIAVLGAALVAACNALWGIDELSYEPHATATGGSAGTGGVGAAAGDGGGGTGPGGAAGWLDGYGKRKSITIHATAIDASLTDFVVAIVLDSDAELAAAAQVDGRDIRFTASDGQTALSHELETFVAATGQLAAWVRVPVLSDAADTVLWLYYDNPSAESTSGSGTWSTLFAGVWHLSDDLSGPGPQVRDSSTHANHGTVAGASAAPVRVPGMAGDAAAFDGVDDQLIIGDPSDDSLDFGSASFSYSIWVFTQASVNNYDTPFAKGANTPPDPGYNFELGASTWVINVDDGTTEFATRFGMEGEFLGTWTHLAAVLDRQNREARVYANGIWRDVEDLTSIGSLSGDADAVLSGPGHHFLGIIDELRVYSAALTEAWIVAEYSNLAESVEFYSLGPEETAPWTGGSEGTAGRGGP